MPKEEADEYAEDYYPFVVEVTLDDIKMTMD